MNYATLKTAVAGWANRTDLAAQLPAFLALAEQRIFFGEPAAQIAPLRVLPMLTAATLTPVSGAVALPADFLDVERVAALPADGNSKTPLTPRSPAGMGRFELTDGAPQFFAVRNGSLVFGPRFAHPVELLYYARPATPSADSDENWLMSQAPGVYLYGMLIEVALYLRDEGLGLAARDLYRNALAGVQYASDQQQAGGMTSLAIMADRGAV